MPDASTGDVSDALAALPGPDAPGLSASTITRLNLIDGFRMRTQSWRELLLDLKRSWPLGMAPWGAGPRCWVHKTANVRNAMPESVQPKAKAHLKDIWMAETKAGADVAFNFFVEACGVKYAKSCSKWRAVKCLTKDRADLLAFYGFPA